MRYLIVIEKGDDNYGASAPNLPGCVAVGDTAEVHRRNAQRLEEIIAQSGWPGRTVVGEEGANSAWLVLQHAVGSPRFQRRGLSLLEEAASQGEVPASQVAQLTDRKRSWSTSASSP